MPRAYLLGLALILAALVGCEESVEPTPGTDSPFTLYGQLDADADTQAVRVIPIAETIDTLDPDVIDARVTSTYLQTGEVREWADSLVRYRDGTEGHVFFAPFAVGYEETYRLEVSRADGETSSTVVTVPPLTTLDSLGRGDAQTEPVYFIGAQDAPRLTGVEARYTFVGDIAPLQIVSHTDAAERVDGGWRVAIPFVRDVRRLLAFADARGVGLADFEVRAYVSNEEWNVDAVGGTFERDVVVQPGTLTNIENGFGFFGAGYELRLPLQPLSQDQIRAGLCILNEEKTGCR